MIAGGSAFATAQNVQVLEAGEEASCAGIRLLSQTSTTQDTEHYATLAVKHIKPHGASGAAVTATLEMLETSAAHPVQALQLLCNLASQQYS